METVAVVFPNQLAASNPVLSHATDVLLLEHSRFFDAFRFHKKKLLFHRATMKAYAGVLVDRGHRVHYVDHGRLTASGGLSGLLRDVASTEVYVADPCDAALNQELDEIASQLEMAVHVLENPTFLGDANVLGGSPGRRQRLSMARFYAAQRKRLNLLIRDGKPVGGKWSFDAQNRRALPKDVIVPKLPIVKGNEWVDEAGRYVEHHFASNPGSVDGFFYPVTHQEAQYWLKAFLEKRLTLFGLYEDAISKDEPFLFHSLLSPLLNAGLITPDDVMARTLAFSERYEVPLNSLEGFIRQIVGWREFMRASYLREGETMRTSNFWGLRNSLPRSFYTARTGVVPVDTAIQRVMDNAFAHHIERLMILGNFMLLCEIHPGDVYRWFMELFIDAYDWVMVPNVYGMSQYADGGSITTKPYISSSNYLRKMSDFPPGSWCDIWNALFWRFIQKHRSVFADNPRTHTMVWQLDRMPEAKRAAHVRLAESYLATLLRS